MEDVKRKELIARKRAEALEKQKQFRTQTAQSAYQKEINARSADAEDAGEQIEADLKESGAVPVTITLDTAFSNSLSAPLAHTGGSGSLRRNSFVLDGKHCKDFTPPLIIY